MLPVDLPQDAIRHALSCAAVSACTSALSLSALARLLDKHIDAAAHLAAYALEQLGLPSLSSGSTERWNGDEPSARLRELEGRR